ncbi:MAG: ABC transporter substrate-binding protein [Candidatus Lumbricidophila eiseniae]|uniref:ABC transporter substrate-binding protein n=1 Tax=Candidatus Lumbricidiphila eiseniae TaxID=1969409 RepID=A0A2A6FUW7_9MICO|nr:MAG: ABC transporter substrate-binding protein [Candidatus Lumbricidophila eiseniae]
MVPSRTPNTVVSEETAVFAGSEIRPSSAPQATRFRTNKIRESDGLVVLAYLWPGLVGFTTFILVPLLGSLLISMFEWPLFGTPTFIGFANYQKMFSDPTFYTVLVNTVIFAFVYTALNLLLALAVSLWLNTKIKFSSFWRVIFFLPAITPVIANALVWRLLLNDNGIVNSVLSSGGITGPSWLSDASFALSTVIAMSVWQSFGYNVIVLSAGLGSIPQEILEASRMDGTNAWQRLRSVILPMISPSLFFTMTMTMIGAFQVFVQPQVLTQGGPGESTNTFVLYMYRNGFVFDRLGYASALAWILFVVVMLITALQFAGQRKWVNYDK